MPNLKEALAGFQKAYPNAQVTDEYDKQFRKANYGFNEEMIKVGNDERAKKDRYENYLYLLRWILRDLSEAETRMKRSVFSARSRQESEGKEPQQQAKDA